MIPAESHQVFQLHISGIQNSMLILPGYLYVVFFYELDSPHVLQQGILDSLALHKDGLYAAGIVSMCLIIWKTSL